jgi:hypothetical protein
MAMIGIGFVGHGSIGRGSKPSYELPHALSPDQDTTSGLFVHLYPGQARPVSV